MLRTLVENLRSLSVVRFPSTEQDNKRASVAAILRVKPGRSVPADQPIAKDVDAFLELDWVKTGTVQLLFIQRCVSLVSLLVPLCPTDLVVSHACRPL